MQPEPFRQEEIEETVKAMLGEGGIFATAPMTLQGIDYDHVFQLSIASLRDLMAMRGAEHAAKELIVYEDERYTFGEVWTKSMRFANWLIKTHEVGAGDRVAIAMRNYPEWVMAFIGVIATGATVVPLNAWWPGDELCEGAERAGTKLVVCDGKRFEAMAGSKDKLGLTFIGVRGEAPQADVQFNEVLEDEVISADVPTVPIDPDSDFCLLYTSGSTGKPKGVLLTHRSATNALISWSFALTMAQRLRPEYPFVAEKPAVLLALPLFHVTAMHIVMLLSWFTGRKTVFMYRWDAEKAAELIKQEQITNMVGVPTMAHDLIQKANPEDLASLIDVSTGGAKRPETQVKDQKEKFERLNASSGYGLTETNAMVAHITLRDYQERPSSAGRAVPPLNQIEAFSEDGKKLPRGKEGEICIKSPLNFRAYLDDEEATKAAFHEGGWFRSGDIGYVDEDNYVYILDRSKDLIIRGGENIGCLEVENALLSFPGVDEATVFAVPDERFGEIVGAVVYSEGGEIDLQALRDHAAGELAAYKVPERIWTSPQTLPRGGTGKVDKRMTRQVALTHPAHWSALS